MNNLHYIGRRVSSFELYDELGPITGVSLLLDDESEPINVGNDTGYVLEVSCPYGTETMAQNILSTVQGKAYKGFRAENAILDPLAELGDHLSIDGSTFLLAHRIAKFGPGHMSEISAPGENELEHEYGWVSPEKKEFNRKISVCRSEIFKNSEAIKLRITKDDAETLIETTLSGISMKVKAPDGKVTSFSLSAGGTIDLTGMVTFTALENGPDENKGQTVIDGGWLTGVKLQGNRILGGTYTNLKEDTWFGLGESNGKWGFRLANTEHEQEGIFGVYNGDFGFMSMVGKAGYTFLMTDGSAETSYPQGTWDFSEANLITKGEVGFVPVFQ